MPTIAIVRSAERRVEQQDWLFSRHVYPSSVLEAQGVRERVPLLAIAEDRVAAGAGFPLHPHRDMEILSYVIEGGIRHADSVGNEAHLGPGELQRMSAGSGIRHSELNASVSAPLHFLQIWIEPAGLGIPPGYEQASFDSGAPLVHLAGPEARSGGVLIHQDVAVWRLAPAIGEALMVPSEDRRFSWLHVVRGSLAVAGEHLQDGDGIALVDEPYLRVDGLAQDTEALVFQMNAMATR